MRLTLHTPPLPPGVRRGEESWVWERSSWRHKHTDSTFLWVKLHLSVTSVAPPRERPFLQRSRLQRTFSFKSIHNRLSNLSWVQLISNFSSRGPSGGMSLNVLPVVSAAGYSWWHTSHRQLWVHLGGRRGLRSGTSSELRPRPEQVRLQHPSVLVIAVLAHVWAYMYVINTDLGSCTCGTTAKRNVIRINVPGLSVSVRESFWNFGWICFIEVSHIDIQPVLAPPLHPHSPQRGRQSFSLFILCFCHPIQICWFQQDKWRLKRWMWPEKNLTWTTNQYWALLLVL